MLLAIDIGNTKIKFGLFDEAGNLKKTFSLQTSTEISASHLSESLSENPKTAVISSVVPNVTDRLADLLSTTFNLEPVIVDHSSNLGLAVNYHPRTAVGIDRLIAASAAAEIYGTPCVVCSLGTATTIDAVNKDREYLGGIIAPGLTTMAVSLHQNTAKLPVVEIYKPDEILGTSTETSIRSGVFYGYLGLVNELVDRVKSQIDGKAIVVATGGNAEMLAAETEAINEIDKYLILKGLNQIARR